MKRSGFTIVELLLVIVIVAIVAAISVVGFSGVQEKAEVAKLEADIATVKKKLESYQVTQGAYPGSLDDCPDPAPSNMCLASAISEDVSYQSFPRTSSGGPGVWLQAGYSVALQGQKQFRLEATMERRGNNEFNRYLDIAPYIDRYGLGTYVLSFDLKSLDTSNRDLVQVYMQNGSTFRYFFNTNVRVSTEYQRYTLEINPTLSSADVAEAYLAFYGTYHTGNIPVVKNISLHKKL